MKSTSADESTTGSVPTSSAGTSTLVLFRQRVEGPSSTHGEQAVSALLSAFELLTHRGDGTEAWASPFRDNVLAFMLDSMGDAANVWGPDGELLYRNRAAEQLGIGHFDDIGVEELTIRGRHFERRAARCRFSGKEYILEIIHDLRYAPVERGSVGSSENDPHVSLR